MSTRASNWVWELEDLGPSEMLVLLALADQANDAGVAWPAQGSLARRARQTDRNVRRMLVKLERMGLLSVERRSSSHGRKSNRYRLHVGARIGESLESRQPDELSGCGGPVDARPAGNSPDSSVSVGISATGQSVRLRKRTDCPVVQPDTSVLPQPDTDVRLPPSTNHHMNHQTGPDRGSVEAGRACASVGSGPGMGPSSHTGGHRAAPGAARSRLDADPPRSAGGPGGGDGPEGASGGPETTERAAEVPRRGGSDRLLRLVDECLPESMWVMDAAGARMVAGLLEARLGAGWRPGEIRAVMDQRLPERVGRMAALVASRLERNVVPGLAPSRGEGGSGADEVERLEAVARRSEELAGTVRRAPDRVEREAWERVRAEMPGASRLEQARAVVARVEERRRGVGEAV